MLGKVLIGLAGQQPLADGKRDLVRLERAECREQVVAGLVLLADDQWRMGAVAQLLAQLGLEQRAFLDDDQEVETGKLGDDLRVERPDEADLEQPQAEPVGLDLINAELVQRLAQIEIALAGADDADLGGGATGEHDPVDVIGTGKGDGGKALVEMEAPLLLEAVVARADVQPASGILKSCG